MGSNTTEHNDTWARFPDAADAYGLKMQNDLEVRRYPHPVCDDAQFMASIEDADHRGERRRLGRRDRERALDGEPHRREDRGDVLTPASRKDSDDDVSVTAGHASTSARCYDSSVTNEGPPDDLYDRVNDERFSRVVGKRRRPTIGEPPPKETRDAMARMANYRTGAPKGVFRYRSHEDANRDRETWTIARAAGSPEAATGEACPAWAEAPETPEAS